MTRAQAITYLGEEFGKLLAGCGLTASDDAAGLKAALDSALLEMGVSYADLPTAVVADGDVRAFRAVLSYYALRQIARAYAPKVDVVTEDPAPQKKWGQAYRSTSEAMKEALKEAQALGHLEDLSEGATPAQYLQFTLDVLEPEVA